MKRIYLFFVLSILLMYYPMGAHARTGSKANGAADNYHFGYVSAAAGYSSLSQDINTAATKGDLGFLAGAGYEFRRSSFWISVGAQYMQEKSKTQIHQNITIENGLDERGREVEYYRWIIDQTDEQILSTIDVPIMLGFYYSGFYVGVGAKAGFSMGSAIKVNGSYDLSCKYLRLSEEFKEVNYYTHYDLPEATFACDLRPQFSIIGEIGFDLLSFVNSNKRLCNVLKLGFYFDCGLKSIRGQQALDAIAINGASIDEAREKQYDIRKTTLNPYFMSKETLDKRIIPYFVGAKLTYMIGGNRFASGTWHRGCQCYGN